MPGSVLVAPDGLSAQYTPEQLLNPLTAYRVRVTNGVTDIAGNVLNSSPSSSFTTAENEDNIAPQVEVISPVDGAVSVPVNALVVVRLDEPVNAVSVAADAVVLSVGGVGVAGSTSIDSNRTTLTFEPDELLTIDTIYDVSVSGFTDRAANTVVPFASSFSTGSSSSADIIRPEVISVTPTNSAVGVDVNTAIVLTFNKVIDASTVNSSSIPVQISGFSGVVAGSYDVSGDEVTFSPDAPLPGNVLIFVTVRNDQVMDIAGNGSGSFSSTFETSEGGDSVAPTVEVITPSDGALSIGKNAVVTLTFSESLNGGTI